MRCPTGIPPQQPRRTNRVSLTLLLIVFGLTVFFVGTIFAAASELERPLRLPIEDSMSYAIANIIYGIPLTEEIHEAANKHKDADIQDLGFETMYSGSAPFIPGFCGVLLCRFDECDDLAVKDLVLVPTEKQMLEAKAKIKDLPAYIRKASKPVDVYLVWSTS